jgi:hypothetical protein
MDQASVRPQPPRAPDERLLPTATTHGSELRLTVRGSLLSALREIAHARDTTIGDVLVQLVGRELLLERHRQQGGRVLLADRGRRPRYELPFYDPARSRRAREIVSSQADGGSMGVTLGPAEARRETGPGGSAIP